MKKLFTYSIMISVYLSAGVFSPASAGDNPMRVNDTHAQEISEPSKTATLTIHHFNEIDTRASRLRAYLLSQNSQLANEAEQFVQEADRYGLDWKLLASISGVESTFGKFIPPNSFNGWGWGIPTGAQSGIAFSSWADAIHQISKGLKENYVNRGAITIEQIGHIYAASPTWSIRVRYFMNQIDQYSPKSPKLLPVSL